MENPQYLHQMHQGSAKVCEVDMVGEEWEVGETWPGCKTLVVV